MPRSFSSADAADSGPHYFEALAQLKELSQPDYEEQLWLVVSRLRAAFPEALRGH